VFDAHVFPLAPGRLHRIVVGYDVNLVPNGSELEYRFDLPEKLPAAGIASPTDVGRAAPPEAVRRTIDVSVGDGPTVGTEPAATPARDGTRRIYHYDDPRAPSIALRLASAPKLLVGSDAATGDFFAARVTPPLVATAVAGGDRAVFAIDTSLSSNPDRFNIWLDLLRATLDANRDTIQQFDVMFFSVDTHWFSPGFVANTPDNVEAVIRFASTLALEGATDLGAALGEAGHFGDGSYDVFLLSDGAATWGESNLHALARRFGTHHPLFAYQTGLAGTDVAALAHLARESGGAVFSVTGPSEVARAATAHRARPYQLVSAEVTGGSDVVIAGRPKAVFPGQSLVVAGRGSPGAGAALRLTVERDGRREILAVPLDAAAASPLAPRVYGQIATDQLEELEAATSPERGRSGEVTSVPTSGSVARAYATHFRVTGKTCSLLMLDSEADYQRFNIKPDADAFVIKETPAGELVGKTIAAIYDTLGDPKAAFVAMLDKLEHIPEIKLSVPASLRLALDKMPAASFAVASTPLATKLVGKEAIPAALASQLAKHDLDYDVVSDAAQRRGNAADVLKALSSLVEEHPGDAVLARDVGFSALDLGQHAQAYHLFRRVAEARPYEPQTYHAMAQALAAMGKVDLALACYEVPLLGAWDPRFGDLHAIVELDYLRFLRKVVADNSSSVPAYARARLDSLAKKVDLARADLVVTITWNTDNTDVDLHVTEPSGEECFYNHRETRSGGRLTRDVTQGYGPEMYVLDRAPGGHYNVRAHYFASNRNRASARTKVRVQVYEDWGTDHERVREKVVALEDNKEWHDVEVVNRTTPRRR
jgi:hypothetical protein